MPSAAARTASRKAAEGARNRVGLVLVGHLVEDGDGQVLGWRGDAAADALGDERACCLHAGPELGVVEQVGVEHHRHLFVFASVEAGRQGSGLVRAVVVAEVAG